MHTTGIFELIESSCIEVLHLTSLRK